MSEAQMDGETQRALADLGKTIREWQQDRGLNDSQMLREFPGLGSTKTYTRILQGDVDELDCERWLKDYRAVAMLIELADIAAREDEWDILDLTTVTDLRSAVGDAMAETGNNRLVLVQGPSGSGKTTAARLLRKRYGARIVLTEANETWKENANAMLGGILRSLGTKQPPVSVAEKFTAAVDALSERRVCLVIDEAHHLGPKTLNLVKSLLNQTPGEFVLLAMGTLWTRLETQAYAEARQLTQNRLSERIRFDAPEVEDVRLIVERRLGIVGDAGRKVASALAQAARTQGCLAFVKLVCRKARKLAGKNEVTAETVAQAAAMVAGTR